MSIKRGKVSNSKSKIKSSSKVGEIQKKLTDSFKVIRQEFDDHLDTINRNTNEIEANYEYLCEVDSKMEKLSERLDEIEMLIKQQNGIKEDYAPEFKVQRLTKREKEVFMALYILEDEKGSVSYPDIARQTLLTESLVQSYITNLMEKGVPVIKRYLHNIVVLSLDRKFKEQQAKNNILGISEEISESLMA